MTEQYLEEPKTEIKKEYVDNLPMDQILADPLFNCRGLDITPASVVDLAEDIRKNGQHQPILVRPYTSLSNPKIKYAVIAGHRRHTAIKFLGKKTIEAFICYGLSEEQAYIINLAENIKRVQLNIGQEAASVAKLMSLGYTDKQIKTELDVSHVWLKVRKELLTLPPEVREEAANGNLSQAHITELAQLVDTKSTEDIIKAAAKIRDKKLKVDKKIEKIEEPKEKEVIVEGVNKFRTNEELDRLQDVMLAVFKGKNLGSRTIAWVRSRITTEEFYADIQEEASFMGISYVPPKDF